MTPKALDDILASIIAGDRPDEHESQLLDFKQEGRKDRETQWTLAEAAACFANADGGTIVLGVKDKVAGEAAIVGTTHTPDWCRQRIHELTNPSLLVDGSSVRSGGKTLVRIDVPRGLVVHEANGRFEHRIGKDCERMTALEIARLSNDRTGADWSAENADASMDAIEPEAMLTLRRGLAAKTSSAALSTSLTDNDVLTQLRLVRRDRSGLINAALILAGDDEESWPRVLYTYRGTAGAEPIVARPYSGPLVRLLDEVMGTVSSRVETVPMNLPNGTQLQVADFPLRAVREALTNALLHRDYRVATAVRIEHSPESLRISSPGPLPPGVTPDNILTHDSTPRNTRLFRAAEKIGLAEELGLGVDRMYRETIRSGHPPPDIVDDRSNVLVVFTRGARNRRFIRFVADLPDAERESVETLLTIRTLLERPTVSSDSLAEIIQKTPAEAEAVLQRLAMQPKNPIIEATRGTRRHREPEYALTGDALRSLGSVVAYNKMTGDEIDRKILMHLREYGRISNKTLQNMLDVDVYRSRDILRKLVERDIIVRTSSQTRGIAVEYGPGTRFDDALD